jgi:SAM-dependent methyltransferase
VLEAVVGALACPHCSAPLELRSGTARCRQGHGFDIARQGYLNLRTGPARTPGDTAEMVAARTEFLASGNYAPIREALTDAVRDDGLVVEIGAGTAYYLAGVVDASERRAGLALDISSYAARRAAKSHPRVGAVVCDAWQRLPVRDGVASVVLDVFAPRNAAEIARILAPGGCLLVVTPDPAHLRELVGALGLIRVDEEKERRLAGALGGLFTRTATTALEWTMALDHRAVGHVVGMGPSAWHTGTTGIDRLPDPVGVTASVTLSRWTVTPGA